jgi:hypothetical protein
MSLKFQDANSGHDPGWCTHSRVQAVRLWRGEVRWQTGPGLLP